MIDRGQAQTSVTGPGPLDHCLTGEDYGARQKCVRDGLASDPQAARFYANLNDPWLEVSDPKKRFQVPVGLDGRRYAVLKWRGQLYGEKALSVALGVGVVGTIVTAGAVLGFTDKGRKFVKGLFK